MKNPLILIPVLGLISLMATGCASTKQSVLPQDGPSMKAIYENHINEMNTRDPVSLRQELGSRNTLSGDSELYGYMRDAANEIDAIFPRIPNPTLVMYVFPHLAGEEAVPVPGYATSFPMYERVEYALPGEIPEQNHSRQH
jgi:conjugative transfer region lipoprotein (TIGR03751 family)